jgi:chemosensory pili system protein ChpA (sensor histidine kinase/response regulator)
MTATHAQSKSSASSHQTSTETAIRGGLLETAEHCLQEDPANLEQARHELTQIAAIAADAGEMDLARLSAMLVDLLLIGQPDERSGGRGDGGQRAKGQGPRAKCQEPKDRRDDSDAAPSAFSPQFSALATEIVEFCRSAIPVVREAVSQQSADTAGIRSLLREAEENWGEYVELLAPQERCPVTFEEDWSSRFPDAWQDSVNEQDADQSAEPATAIDMDLILSTLGEMDPAGGSGAVGVQGDASEENGRGHNARDGGREATGGRGESGNGASKPLPFVPPSPLSPSSSSPPTQPLPPPDFSRIDSELLACFIDDAEHCLEGMEDSLLRIESGLSGTAGVDDVERAESLRQFCRELHTLKGAAGTVGLSELAGYLHRLEDQVETMSTGAAAVDVELLLAGVDVVRTQIGAAGGESPNASASPPPKPAATVSPVESTSPGKLRTDVSGDMHGSARSAAVRVGTAGEGDDFVRIESARLDRLMDLLAELVMLRNRRDTYLSQIKELHQELHACVRRLRFCGTRGATETLGAEGLGEVLGAEGQRGRGDGGTEETRGRGDRGDGAIDRVPCVPPSPASPLSPSSPPPPDPSSRESLLLRMLLEAADDISELNKTLRDVYEPLETDNAAVSHLVGRFRQELTELRRLPVTGLFRRLQRVVREAARMEGKQVELEFRGQGTRAERLLQERLFDPLMHLVRNAVSHGIESPAERRSAGKPECGRIILTTCSSGSALLIEIRDDGRGLNEEALERRGLELGLLAPEESVRSEQLWKLIFHPGFSTRKEVNEIAGRGVGMDVVAARIRQLRGRYDVESVPGCGTTFRLQIPLRTPIEHAMIVRINGQLFALPMQSVYGTGNPGEPGGGDEPDLHGDRDPQETTGCVDLGTLLGLRNGDPQRNRRSRNRHNRNRHNRNRHSRNRHSRNHNIREGDLPHGVSAHRTKLSSGQALLTLRHQTTGNEGVSRQLCVAVDSVVGVEEVVVRSLPPMLQGHELFAGVTLSGDAETVLLFDVPRLIECGLDAEDSTISPSDLPETAVRSGRRPADRRRPGRVLIVDDSVSVRRALVRKLHEHGIETAQAADGLQALDLLRGEEFAGVVTDLDMPRLGGAELLAEIRRRPLLKELPVVVVTSRTDPETLDRVQRLHPRQILMKPVTKETLATLVNEFQHSHLEETP